MSCLMAAVRLGGGPIGAHMLKLLRFLQRCKRETLASEIAIVFDGSQVTLFAIWHMGDNEFRISDNISIEKIEVIRPHLIGTITDNFFARAREVYQRIKNLA